MYSLTLRLNQVVSEPILSIPGSNDRQFKMEVSMFGRGGARITLYLLKIAFDGES